MKIILRLILVALIVPFTAQGFGTWTIRNTCGPNKIFTSIGITAPGAGTISGSYIYATDGSSLNNPPYVLNLENHFDGHGSSVVFTLGWYERTPTGTNVYFTANTPAIDSGGNFTLEVGDGCAPCYSNLVWNVHNTDSRPRTFAVTYGNLPTDVAIPSGQWAEIPAGGSHTFSLTVPCNDVPLVKLFQISGSTVETDGGLVADQLNGADWNDTGVAPTGSSGSASGGSADQQGSGVVYNANNPTNSPIVWQAGASTNAATAIQNASAAMLDTTIKGNQQEHTDLMAIKDSIDRLGAFTNGVFNGTGTNIFSLTNYAHESTLVGLSNLFASALTNGLGTNGIQGAVNAQGELGEDQAQAGRDVLASLADGVSLPDPTERYGTPTSDWEITINYMGEHTVYLDPFHYEWVTALAEFIRNLAAWCCAIGLAIWNSKLLINTIQSLFMFRQAQTAGGSLFGNNVNPLACVIVAVAITAVTLAVPMYFSDWYGANGIISNFSAHPFHGSHPTALATSIYIADQFFPLAFMVWCLFARFLFRIALAPILWLVGVTIRFLVGL